MFDLPALTAAAKITHGPRLVVRQENKRQPVIGPSADQTQHYTKESMSIMCCFKNLLERAFGKTATKPAILDPKGSTALTPGGIRKATQVAAKTINGQHCPTVTRQLIKDVADGSWQEKDYSASDRSLMPFMVAAANIENPGWKLNYAPNPEEAIREIVAQWCPSGDDYHAYFVVCSGGEPAHFATVDCRSIRGELSLIVLDPGKQNDPGSEVLVNELTRAVNEAVVSAPKAGKLRLAVVGLDMQERRSDSGIISLANAKKLHRQADLEQLHQLNVGSVDNPPPGAEPYISADCAKKHVPACIYERAPGPRQHNIELLVNTARIENPGWKLNYAPNPDAAIKEIVEQWRPSDDDYHAYFVVCSGGEPPHFATVDCRSIRGELSLIVLDPGKQNDPGSKDLVDELTRAVNEAVVSAPEAAPEAGKLRLAVVCLETQESHSDSGIISLANAQKLHRQADLKRLHLCNVESVDNHPWGSGPYVSADTHVAKVHVPPCIYERAPGTAALEERLQEYHNLMPLMNASSRPDNNQEAEPGAAKAQAQHTGASPHPSNASPAKTPDMAQAGTSQRSIPAPADSSTHATESVIPEEQSPQRAPVAAEITAQVQESLAPRAPHLARPLPEAPDDDARLQQIMTQLVTDLDNGDWSHADYSLIDRQYMPQLIKAATLDEPDLKLRYMPTPKDAIDAIFAQARDGDSHESYIVGNDGKNTHFTHIDCRLINGDLSIVVLDPCDTEDTSAKELLNELIKALNDTIDTNPAAGRNLKFSIVGMGIQESASESGIISLSNAIKAHREGEGLEQIHQFNVENEAYVPGKTAALVTQKNADAILPSYLYEHTQSKNRVSAYLRNQKSPNVGKTPLQKHYARHALKLGDDRKMNPWAHKERIRAFGLLMGIGGGNYIARLTERLHKDFASPNWSRKDYGATDRRDMPHLIMAANQAQPGLKLRYAPSPKSAINAILSQQESAQDADYHESYIVGSAGKDIHFAHIDCRSINGELSIIVLDPCAAEDPDAKKLLEGFLEALNEAITKNPALGQRIKLSIACMEIQESASESGIICLSNAIRIHQDKEGLNQAHQCNVDSDPYIPEKTQVLVPRDDMDEVLPSCLYEHTQSLERLNAYVSKHENPETRRFKKGETPLQKHYAKHVRATADRTTMNSWAHQERLRAYDRLMDTPPPVATGLTPFQRTDSANTIGRLSADLAGQDWARRDNIMTTAAPSTSKARVSPLPTFTSERLEGSAQAPEPGRAKNRPSPPRLVMLDKNSDIATVTQQLTDQLADRSCLNFDYGALDRRWMPQLVEAVKREHAGLNLKYDHSPKDLIITSVVRLLEDNDYHDRFIVGTSGEDNHFAIIDCRIMRTKTPLPLTGQRISFTKKKLSIIILDPCAADAPGPKALQLEVAEAIKNALSRVTFMLDQIAVSTFCMDIQHSRSESGIISLANAAKLHQARENLEEAHRLNVTTTHRADDTGLQLIPTKEMDECLPPNLFACTQLKDRLESYLERHTVKDAQGKAQDATDLREEFALHAEALTDGQMMNLLAHEERVRAYKRVIASTPN